MKFSIRPGHLVYFGLWVMVMLNGLGKIGDYVKESEIIASIIIPCFNPNPNWMNMTLESIRNQTIAHHLEVIIIDDGSDPKVTINEDLYKNFPIRIYRHWWNRGLSSARNSGAILSRGKYLVFLDPDDFMDSTTIEKMILLKESMDHDQKLAFVYPGVVHFEDLTEKILSIERSVFDKNRLKRENYIPSFALIPRNLYLEVGGMCEGKIRYFEDYDFWLRIVGLGYRGILLDEPLFYYRRHEKGLHFKITNQDVDFMQELRIANPSMFGDIINDGGITSKILSCYRPIPEYGIFGLYCWRIFGLSQIIKRRPYSFIPFSPLKPINSSPSILLMIPWMQIGGAEYYDLDIIKMMKGLNYRITILTDVNLKDHPLQDAYERLVDEIFHLPKLRGPSSELSLIDLAEHFVKTRNFDLVIIRNSLIGYKLSRRKPMNIPFIDINHVNKPLDKSGWAYKSKKYTNYLAKRIVISSTLKDLLQTTSNSSQNNTIVIPPAVNFSDLKKSFYSKPVCPNETPITIIFSGRLTQQKDPLLWISTVESIAIKYPKYFFLIIGDGELKGHVLDRLEKSIHLRDRYERLPFLGRFELAEYLMVGLKKDGFGVIRKGTCKGKTILLMTSEYEGIPITMLEAAVLNVPTVIGNIGAIPEAKERIGPLIKIANNRTVAGFVNEILSAFDDLVPEKDFPFDYTMESFRTSILSLISDLIPSEKGNFPEI